MLLIAIHALQSFSNILLSNFLSNLPFTCGAPYLKLDQCQAKGINPDEPTIVAGETELLGTDNANSPSTSEIKILLYLLPLVRKAKSFFLAFLDHWN